MDWWEELVHIWQYRCVCLTVFHVHRPESQQPDGPFQLRFCSAQTPDSRGLSAKILKAPPLSSCCPDMTEGRRGWWGISVCQHLEVTVYMAVWETPMFLLLSLVRIQAVYTSVVVQTFSKSKRSVSLDTSFSLLVSLAKSRCKRRRKTEKSPLMSDRWQ